MPLQRVRHRQRLLAGEAAADEDGQPAPADEQAHAPLAVAGAGALSGEGAALQRRRLGRGAESGAISIQNVSKPRRYVRPTSLSRGRGPVRGLRMPLPPNQCGAAPVRGSARSGSVATVTRRYPAGVHVGAGGR